MARHAFTSVDEFIESFEDEVTRTRLNEIRALVKQELPQAEERISYNIPAYFVNKKPVIYFAGYAKHVGMYPARTGDQAFNDSIATYMHGKSTMQIAHTEPIPTELVKQLIAVRLAESQK